MAASCTLASPWIRSLKLPASGVSDLELDFVFNKASNLASYYFSHDRLTFTIFLTKFESF